MKKWHHPHQKPQLKLRKKRPSRACWDHGCSPSGIFVAYFTFLRIVVLFVAVRSLSVTEFNKTDHDVEYW